MKIMETTIEDLKLVEASPVMDKRGQFSRWFCAKELSEFLNGQSILQVNQSMSLKSSTVRGLHFQRPPYTEMKIVRCIRGRVWDVAVDLRQESPTFLKWYGHELTAQNQLMMIIPQRFAHGYQAIEPESELLYLNTAYYEPSAEGAIQAEDPTLAIDWPLPVENLSLRDASSPFLTKDFKGISA